MRQRLLIAALTTLPGLQYEDIIAGKTVLHFAPEPGISKLLRPIACEYITSNFGGENSLDLTKMDGIQSNYFDVIIACDVLEHVDDDIRAMREIYRVLRDGGVAILTVPQQDNLPRTFEDKSITNPEDRLRAFGQEDHLRIYGDDFVDRLSAQGFSVRIVTASDFAPAMVSKHVLFPPEISAHPLATNHRKIYFANR